MRLGNSTSICKKYGVDDAEQWCCDYIYKLNEAAKVVLNLSMSSSFQTGSFRKGSNSATMQATLFLQQIYYRLGIHDISRAIARKHDFEYDLNSIFSRLIYLRFFTLLRNLQLINSPKSL